MNRWVNFIVAWTGSSILAGAFLPVGLLIPKQNMLLLMFLTGIFSWLLSGRIENHER